MGKKILIKSEKAARQTRTDLQPYMIDPQQHVKVWISRDGLPDKHKARFIKFRALNPNAILRLVYVNKYLTDSARKDLEKFSKKLNLLLIDYETIKPVGDDEVAIKACIDREIEYFFTMNNPDLQGDLSRVADQLALFDQVIRWGIRSDCDVEFSSPMPMQSISAPLGIIARQKENGTRVSNDLTAGDPQHPVFIVARKLARNFNHFYDAALPNYFSENQITFDPENYQQHLHYFEARNKQRKQFSLGGGPQLFAIAQNYCGIRTGYENKLNEIFELREQAGMKFFPYEFLSVGENEQQVKEDFEKLFPVDLGAVDSGWDTSWMPNQTNWKKLTTSEQIRLTLFNNGMQPSSQLLIIEKLLSSIPKPKLSYLKSYLGNFLKPLLLGKRHKEYSELPSSIQEYIKKNETPDEMLRKDLATSLGSSFSQIARQLQQEGVIVLPSYISQEKLENLRSAYEREIGKKKSHPLLKQVSFNLAADENCDPELLPAALQVGHDPGLQALVRYHLGEQKLCAMRGYRQEPVAPVRLRAWDWHQDIKSQGPYGEIKIMILLNGVEIDGQAMRAMLGSHQYHWAATQLAGSKYTLDEALGYAVDGVKICYGPPGTIVIFDTNIIHSGHRNLSERRDIITMSYAPDKPDIADMFNVPDAAKLDKLNYQFHSSFWQSVNVDDTTLTDVQIAQLKEAYQQCPTLAEFKDRYLSNSNIAFINFLSHIASQDMNGDLNLPLRLFTTMDKVRDNQMVEFRDASPNHIQFTRLQKRLQKQHPEIGYNLHMDTLIEYAKKAGELVEHSINKVSSCARFSTDLAEAFSRIDSIQRLRSTIIYLYFTLDRIQHELNNHDQQQAIVFDKMATRVLDMYASAVFLDDLNEELTASVGLNMNLH